MALEAPTMKWPFRLVNGKVQFVEQDTAVEVEQCVGLVVATEPGGFVDEPDFGMADPTFEQNGVTVGEIEAAVSKWEPRAILSFGQDVLVGGAQTVGITVSTRSNE